MWFGVCLQRIHGKMGWLSVPNAIIEIPMGCNKESSSSCITALMLYMRFSLLIISLFAVSKKTGFEVTNSHFWTEKVALILDNLYYSFS